jgi:hypothetical protein
MEFDAEDLELLPASLQRVGVGFRGWQRPPSASRKKLQLGHLTAVTDLELVVMNEDELFAGPDGDVLPPNLVRLRGVVSGASVEVLKGLPSLRHLDGPHCTDILVGFAAAGLAAQLTHVGVWVPLREGGEVVDEGGNVHPADAAFGLAGAVKRLQEAGVAGIVRDVELGPVASPGVELSPAVIAELRCLPNLQNLWLVKVPFDVARLLDLTQLTRLEVLWYTNFSSDHYLVLPGVLARLPSLRELVMHKPRPDVPAAVRDAFADGIAGLTHLSATLW